MEFSALIRLFLAGIFSGLIGLEREVHGRAAGLRTHILVGCGACLIMLTSLYVHAMYGSSADPGRIAAQVVSGIGFLGAGTIIRFRASVRGLTTAASLWAVAGIGLAVGSGLYLPATYTTLLIICVLFLLSEIERRVLRRSLYKLLVIDTYGDMMQLKKVRDLLSDYNVEIRDMDIKILGPQEDKYRIEMNVRVWDRYESEIANEVSRIKGVLSVKWL
ncbi:MAG: hypothetical protein B6D53_03850 [Candidatus Omnitrophica bacterium 4484_49]|nr:MgtC/SapB family protein [Candidatus Omnitrophota bacterium]OQX82750.1 MAG: hypothetical protein B6D53_03850 [Candidatus Omnitrophica bacterium 4484_49]RKY37287.1 MAG: methyltransferase [Candidatus Omnitrophota bacterium]